MVEETKKELDFISNIDKKINNYIKVNGLTYEIEKVYYEEKYYKFLRFRVQ